MVTQRLKEFLDGEGVRYVRIIHSPAYTAQEIAQSAHVPGREVAKTVIVKLDGKPAMAVMPATRRVSFDKLKAAAGAGSAELADETEFESLFPGCELGAMPPFGNLYGLDVFVDEALAEDDEIAFNAGSHTELMRLAFDDFRRLVHPKMAKLA